MFRISVPTEKDKYDLAELARMFVPASQLDIISRESMDVSELMGSAGEYFKIPSAGLKNDHKRLLYEYLSEATGKTLDWGILTGVRPSKLYRHICDQRGKEDADREFREGYYVSEEKLGLVSRIYDVQSTVRRDSDPNAIGVYVGIPFCPTRCVYCAFTSNKISRPAAEKYMEALLKEISFTADLMKERNWRAESIYIGGGTPTSLDDDHFEALLSAVREKLYSAGTKEFTVEAGRPDTITESKLELIKQYGGDRISINPQSMKQETLDAIGRSHTPDQILDAFRMAKEKGFDRINADLITGLPGEGPQDFVNSLETIIAQDPANITVHTLAVKRASRLIEEDPDYAYRQGETVREMLRAASEMLPAAGYEPYYMYRQKHMAGNFENVGWCRPGTANIYNIRIMEEDQTILALGAGGISKIYYPSEDRLERIPNVSNYEIYIERIDEMLERKRKGTA